MDVFQENLINVKTPFSRKKSPWKFWCEVGKNNPSPGWHAVMALLPFGPTLCVAKLFLPLH